jgi:integrase
MTLGEAFELYMTRHVKANGIKRAMDMRQTFERYLGELPDLPKKRHGKKRTKADGSVNWQNRKLALISRGDVSLLHSNLGRAHTVMANRVVELLSAIFGRLVHWQLYNDNPAANIEPFKETKRKRYLQPSELPRFFEALAADSSEDFKAFVALSLLTGARRNNVLAMRWADVDLDRGVWSIPAEVSKNDEPMEVPLVPEAVAILQARSEPHSATGHVFAANSTSGHMTPPKKRWAQLFKRIKVDGEPIVDLRLHDLRRSLGSWQAIQGASLLIVGRSLGHKSPSASAVYAHLSIDPVRASMERATSAMLVAGGVKQAATVANVGRRKRRSAPE